MASTCVVESRTQESPTAPSADATYPARVPGSEIGVEDGSNPPAAAARALEKWNSPRSNIHRTMATFWSFIVMGANDAAYGALIPYLETYYNLTYTIVSLVFLSPFIGYVLAALLNHRIHNAFGQRGVAILSPSCHLIAYIVNCLHPPYPVLVISFVFAGFGNGLGDSAWNAWLGNMANANELLGMLHGFYGMGAVLSPLVATSIITKADCPWYYFYYIMITFAAIELGTITAAFWPKTGAVFRETIGQSASDSHKGGLRHALFRYPFARVTWICAVFLLIYVGIEVALGGWIVTFMIRVRQGGAFASGMVATGFWLGITVGRVTLGFVTPRVGETIAIATYILCSIGCDLVIWLVPQFYASAAAVAVQGFFLGPLFPAAVVMTTKLLPRHLHVSSIGFAAAFGGGGAAVLPFAVGAMAQTKGVNVLQPFIVGMSGGILVLWLGLPRVSKTRGE